MVELALVPLVWPVTVTLVAGALAFALARWSSLVCKVLAVLAALCVLVEGIVILARDIPPLRWVWVQELTESISLTVDLTPSPLGLLVVIAGAAFTLLIALYSFRDLAGAQDEGKFYAYLTWSLGGACLVGLAGNLLVLLVGWEVVTLMLFLLVNQGGSGAPKGAMKAYGVLGFADACLLLGVALLVSLTGGTENLVLANGPVDLARAGGTGYLIFILLMVAALAKAGAVPVHTWIPDIAPSAPTPVMAFLPAALDKLLGIYLLAVLTLQMFRPDGAMQVVLMIVGAVTILSAVLMAMMQHNLKRLLSFHAVSQVGYMVLGIGTGTAVGVIGGLFHMLNHAMYKSNLFLMGGTVGHASGSDEIEDMGGLARRLPVTFVCGLISALAISGVPPLNGFVSKWLVYQGALKVSERYSGLAVGLVVVAVFGSALTLASFVKVIYSAFLSPAPRRTAARVARVREQFLRAAPMVVLAGACVFFGLRPDLVIRHVFAPALPEAARAVSTTDLALRTEDLGYWSPTQATGLILLGLLLGLVFLGLVTLGKWVRVVRPFLAGEVPEPDDDRFRLPGTAFYRTIARLPLLGPWLEQAEQGAVDPYHWSARHGNTFVQMLRRFHTGLVSLYVAWCLSGLTIILVYLLVSART
jgi:formate hydrogenlyase subunit 3/multisubunit Na+/H+ antiporter MnhD subunit